MKVLTDYITAFIELVEAEFRDLRRGIFRMHVGIIVMAGAGCMVLLAFGLFLSALFVFVSWHLNTALALVITGAAALVIGLIVAEIGLWINR